MPQHSEGLGTQMDWGTVPQQSRRIEVERAVTDPDAPLRWTGQGSTPCCTPQE
jgi:hypothetical protein